ncbi:hypothetical protein C8J57DRAFT_317974 [Mycena rebaudengoi]|nr:hypothetical protein C8J57DRAFT_317974 [Mycena rebaudengoi]
MCGHDRLRPPHARHGRRRSADIGGLHLATSQNGEHGQGWLGHSGELQTRFAELLSDMYTQTLNAVKEYSADCVSTDLPPETRLRLITALDSWNFEPRMITDESHVVQCAIILFEGLFRIEGMEESVGISLSQIPAFIHHLRQIYRWQNSYHNFEHALDVLQASYSYLRGAGMVPPLTILLEPSTRMWKPTRVFDSGPLMTSLELHDLFIIYIAAIGHDVGHPGFTNLFMNNAATPLSVVFDGKSALEQMHCQLLLRVMRHHGLGCILDDPKRGVQMRKLLWETVLATDMSVHTAFMERFQNLIKDREGSTLMYRRITICQAILKCADISNPSRPYYISQHWATALMREWNSQAILEKHHQLPPTVESSDHPMKEVHSQIFFIPNFVKPLLDLTMQAVPEMRPYVSQCDLNLVLWTAKLKALQKAENANNDTNDTKTPTTTRATRKPNKTRVVTVTPKARTVVPPRQPEDYNSAFPLTLPAGHRSTTTPATTPFASGDTPLLSWSPLPPILFPPPSSSSSSNSSATFSPPPSYASCPPSEGEGEAESEEGSGASDTASFTFSGSSVRPPSSASTSTSSPAPTSASSATPTSSIVCA